MRSVETQIARSGDVDIAYPVIVDGPLGGAHALKGMSDEWRSFSVESV